MRRAGRVGVDYYRKVITLEKRYALAHVRCENDLQTNGVLLDDAWCEFLREERFLVGLSIDGPRALHDEGGRRGHSLVPAFGAGMSPRVRIPPLPPFSWRYIIYHPGYRRPPDADHQLTPGAVTVAA